MKTILLIIGQPSAERDVWVKAFEFCRDEVREILKATPAAIQIAINTWLIDIEKDLSKLSEAVLACHKSNIAYFVIYSLQKCHDSPASELSYLCPYDLKDDLERFLDQSSTDPKEPS